MILMDKPSFYTEDTIDAEADKQQEIYDLIGEFDDEELEYPEYDDVTTSF